jgi:hypothetical protein
LAGPTYSGVNVLLAIIVFTFVTVALCFTYTWFYVASSGSVVVAAVFHCEHQQILRHLLGTAASLRGNPVCAERR